MAGLTEELKIFITGNAQGAIAAYRETGSASEALQAKTTTTGKAMQKLGLQGQEGGALLKAGIVGGATAAGLAIAKFAFDGAQKFSDLTAQTRSLRNVMGGTAEDASRIAGTARQLGLDVDTVSKGFFQLTKRIADGKDTLQQYGVEVVRNNDGSVNMAKTLLNVSDGFKAITDPAERNLFLMQNFGKAGANLIPLLSQGRDALAKFYEQTAKHGEVFSDEDLQKGRDYKIAMNELNQAWEGLSATLGKNLVPLITDFARGLDTVVTDIPKAVSAVSDFASSIADFIDFNHGVRDTFVAGWDAIIDELGLAGDAAQDLNHNFGNLQERFAGLDSGAAADSFLQMAVESAKAGDSVGGMNEELLNFVKIAQTDVGLAAQVIKGLKDRGFNTDIYEQALKRIAGTKLEDAKASQEAKDAADLLTGSYDQQLKVLNRLEDAELAKIDKTFAAERAALAATDAFKDYAEKQQAAADAGYQNADANEDTQKALIDAEEAAIRASVATRDKVEADNEAAGSSDAHAKAIHAQISQLADFANSLAPDSPLRVAIEQYIQKLSDPAINGVHVAGVNVAGLDQTLEGLANLKGLLEELTSQNYEVRVIVDGGVAPVGGFFGAGSNAGV